MLLRCLRRNVEASCHTLRRRLPPSTNSAAYQRLVSPTCHGPSQLSVLHLVLEPFTARDGARYWLRIAIFFTHPTCIRCIPRRNIATTFGMEKLEWCRGVDTRWWKHFEYTITRFDRIHERDGRAGRRTPHDDISRAGIASRGKNETKKPYCGKLCIRRDRPRCRIKIKFCLWCGLLELDQSIDFRQNRFSYFGDVLVEFSLFLVVWSIR